MRAFLDLTRSQRNWLIGIILFGFIARVAWIFVMPYYVPVAEQSDPQEYNQLAKNLIDGTGYRLTGLTGHFAFLMGDRIDEPSARRPPLYPVLLAAIYSIFGERYRVVFLVHCLFDVLTMLAVFAIGRRLFGSINVALIATGLMALYPPFFQQNIVIMTEGLNMLLTTLYLWAAIEAISEPRIWRFIVTGLLLGAAALTRPEAFYFAVPLSIVMLAVLLAQKVQLKRAILMPVLMLLMMLVADSPWLIRNAVVFDRFFPGTTLVGTNVMEGLYIPTQDESKGILTSLPPYVLPKVEGTTEMDANDILLDEAIKFLFKHPVSYIKAAPGKVIKMWLNATDWREHYFLYYPTTNRNHYIQYSLLIPNLLLLVFACIAMIRYRGRWLIYSSPILLAIAFFTFAETFLVSVGRHSVKLIPALAVISAYGLYRMLPVGKEAAD
ncbi:MAG: glycosyltransferase family 39 protein [Candidatus Coatesbacteria bacterium]|nr:glycosyltransferase family 39 protein [Candidatus Coatesbacteria bacterium]